MMDDIGAVELFQDYISLAFNDYVIGLMIQKELDGSDRLPSNKELQMLEFASWSKQLFEGTYKGEQLIKEAKRMVETNNIKLRRIG